MQLTRNCGAGPVTVQRFKNGKLVKQFEVPAPTLESVKDPVLKRGPKPGHKGEMATKEARFAASSNWY